jgi:four helix bundle protein
MIMKKFRFRKFQVYVDLRVFAVDIKKLIKKKFPNEEKFCLTSQLMRALYSIVLNIAEGSDRCTDKDFARFLNNAHTSLNEVVACLDIALDSCYLVEAEHKGCLSQAKEIANQLTAFRNKVLGGND